MVEKYLKAKVEELLPSLTGSIFPGAAPEHTAVPYAVYTCTGASAKTALTPGAVLNTESIQLDFFTATYKEAKGCFDIMKAALVDYRGDLCGFPVQRIKLVNAMDGYEPLALVQRATVEYDITY